MIEIKLKNKKGSVSSKEVKELLDLRTDIDYAQDISNTIKQDNIMVFDCKLDEGIFDFQDVEEAIEDIDEDIDPSYFEVMFEDVRAFLKDSTDEIEAELQELYSCDNLRCSFDVYNVDDTFTDFKFVLVVSFNDIKISSLTNLANIVSRRQLVGASKFYS